MPRDTFAGVSATKCEACITEYVGPLWHCALMASVSLLLLSSVVITVVMDINQEADKLHTQPWLTLVATVPVAIVAVLQCRAKASHSKVVHGFQMLATGYAVTLCLLNGTNARKADDQTYTIVYWAGIVGGIGLFASSAMDVVKTTRKPAAKLYTAGKSAGKSAGRIAGSLKRSAKGATSGLKSAASGLKSAASDVKNTAEAEAKGGRYV